MRRRNHQAGFTLAELMVSLSLFGIIGAGLSGFMVDTLRRSSLENRISAATQELQNAMQLMTSELRLSSQISPYLPGTVTTVTTCTSATSVTGTTMRFLVAHDDASGTNGLTRYLVGYRYNAATRELFRGEIVSSGATSCSVPAGDPADAGNGALIASNVVQIDRDNNGSIDPVFSKSGDLVTINLGTTVSVNSKLSMTQQMSSEVLLRSN